MELRKTIIALLVLAIIGGFAYYVSRQPEPQKTHKLFEHLTAADIQQIDLHGPARDLLLERGKPGLWRIVKPVETDADAASADTLAKSIADLEVVETVDENPGDLANFGLENPSVTVTVTTTDKRVLPGIVVGKDTPIGGNSYIKTTDKPAVLLVGAGFLAEAKKTLNDLRSRAMIGLTAEQMNRVAITRPDGSVLEVVRKGDDWTITKPREYPADKPSVQQLLDVLAGSRAAEFIEDKPEDLDKFGLAKPALEIEVSGGKDNAQQSLAFGFKQAEAGKNAVYARGSQGDRPVCTVAEYVIKAVDKSFDDLRDKTVLAFDEANVARVTLIGGPVSIVVERAAGDKWNVMAAGRTAPAEHQVASSLLDQLHGLKGTRIVEDPMTDAERYGMVHPNLTATVYDKSGKEIGTINVSEIEARMGADNPSGKPVKQVFGYATSSADKAVYEILPDKVVDLENTASTLKSEAEPKPAASSSPSPAVSAAATPVKSPMPLRAPATP
jgi:hypothetical protein